MILSVITTIGKNAGDSFVYEGFRNLFPVKHYGSVFLIDKTTVPKDRRYRELMDESDLIVICGTPIFYRDCYRMKWQNRILEYSEASGKKILLFAVGSNFRCAPDGTIEIPDTAKDNNYAGFATRYKRLILGNFIVRDRYCSRFLEGMGFKDVYQVVCPSFFASDWNFPQNDRDLIFVVWGDTNWNCTLPAEKILKICQDIREALKVRFSDRKVIWVCHDIGSYTRLIKRVDRRDVLFSNNYEDFFKYYSRCYFAFSVKLHGSMLLASMGVPSLLLQLDSRASVMEALYEDYATPSHSLGSLIDMCDKKVRNISEYRDKINFLKIKYREEYRALFNSLGFV